MLERVDSGQEEVEKEGCRTGGMKGRKCAGPELCKAEGMPDKRDAGQ